MDDVIELKSESRASFYSQYTLNLDASCDTNCSLSARGKRLRSGNLNRLLPPLENSQELKLSGIIQVPANNKQTYHLLQTTAIPLQLPTTANKKRLPDKIRAINNKTNSAKLNDTDDYIKHISSNNIRDCDTPLTIDILSESGRTSKLSGLEFITPRDLQGKLPNKNTSNKDPILNKNFNNLNATHITHQEDPLLTYSNYSKLENSIDKNKKSIKINLKATKVDDNYFNNKSSSFEERNTNNIFTNMNSQKNSDFQLNMSTDSVASVSDNRVFHNRTYFLDIKSASTDFDYTDTDFIEENNSDSDDDDDDDDDNTKINKTDEEEMMDTTDDESSNHIFVNEIVDDDSEDEYNHLTRVAPFQIGKSNNSQIFENDSRLDTIDESIRESNYVSISKINESILNKGEILKPVENEQKNENIAGKTSPVKIITCDKNKVITQQKQPIPTARKTLNNNNNTKNTNCSSKLIVKPPCNDVKNPKTKQNINSKVQVPTKNVNTIENIKKPFVRQNSSSTILNKFKIVNNNYNNNNCTPVKKDNQNIVKNEKEQLLNITPNIIETCRIQKTKENTIVVNDTEKSTASESVKSQALNTNVKADNKKPTPPPKLNKTQSSNKMTINNQNLSLKQKSLSSQNLEINSNKINLNTKPPSAKSKKPLNESITNLIESQAQNSVQPIVNNSNDQKKSINPQSINSDNILDPQPLAIYDMFANFEHPFATTNTVRNTKSATVRCASAPRKCTGTSSKPKKSNTVTRKKTKKSKNKTKKIIVSKSEINIGQTTNFSLTDATSNNNKNDELVIFVNPTEDNISNISDNENDDNNFKIDDENDDDSSSVTSENSIKNIPIVSIGDITTVTASIQNEIEIDNGDLNNNNESLTNELDKIDEIEKENFVLFDENRLKSVSDKVDVLRAKLDNVLNASETKPIENQINTKVETNKQQIKDSSNSSLNFNVKNNIVTDTTKDSINSNTNNNYVNMTSLRSTKTNVNIRDVYTMVNSLKNKPSENAQYEKNTQSLNTNLSKKGLPPRPINKDKSDKSVNLYELPPVLTNKLCNLIEMTTAQNELIKNNLKVSPLGNYELLNGTLTSNVQQKEKVSRNNYNLSLDSVGSETIKSSNSASDENTSHSYEKTYRNDPANPTSSRQIFDIKDYNEFAYKWKRGMHIGKGAFGMVYQALLSTGAIIAVKQVEMEETDPQKARKEYENIREEVNILKELDHENIVKFLGTSLEDNTVNIFMEFIPGGTIESLLKTYGPFDEILLKKFTIQITKGVAYIHLNNVVHRDIKGKNIMLMQNGVIKLIDFGCAKRLKKNQSENSMKNLLKSLKGTPYWMAPEVIRETGHGSKADIWSLGCTVFEMGTGRPPWNEMKPIAAIYAIGSGDSEPPRLPEHFSEDARDFVKLCLLRNPDERPTADELLNHPFLNNLEES